MDAKKTSQFGKSSPVSISTSNKLMKISEKILDITACIITERVSNDIDQAYSHS